MNRLKANRNQGQKHKHQDSCTQQQRQALQAQEPTSIRVAYTSPAIRQAVPTKDDVRAMQTAGTKTAETNKLRRACKRASQAKRTNTPSSKVEKEAALGPRVQSSATSDADDVNHDLGMSTSRIISGKI